MVKHKSTWDRQRENAKLLDLESPVDARREVSVDETEDERDLKTSIAHREKQGSRTDSYINYRIVTEAIRPIHLYEESSYEVWRRYRDFEWLRAQVERSHPTLILPVSHSVAR
ncbi:Sorting nexin-7 [Geodia barretti]|nr:Sorting nexin-7 [Geodia barretti]